jgi:hypothetical protein
MSPEANPQEHKMAEQQAPSGNGPEPEAIQNYVSEIETCHEDLDKLRSEHMLKCKDVRATIKGLLKNAKADDINPKSLMAAVTQRALERKTKAIADNLDMVEQAQLHSIRVALGDLFDTPLGVASRNGGARARV